RTQPGNGNGGSALSTQPLLTVQDAGGNTVTTDSSSVTVAIRRAPCSGTLSGTKVVAAVKGVASCSSLSIDKAGPGYTRRASDGPLPSATCATINSTVGPAALLASTQQSSNSTGGVALATQPKLTVQDAGGNTVTTDSSSVTV